MVKLIAVVALVALGYWYYTGPYQHRVLTPEQQAQENARLMDRCKREEARMAAGSGLAGAMGDAGDTEAVCADKLGLERRDGAWVPVQP